MFDNAHHHDDVCCSGSPTRIGSVSIVWCSAHQCATVYASVVEYDLDQTDVVWHDHFNGGPFDSKADQEAQVTRLLTGMLRSM